MFGETEYDPKRQYDSISLEEQLDALGKAVDAGKVGDSPMDLAFLFCLLSGHNKE